MNYTVGIDSGSTATKGILLADGVIVRRFLCPTPFRPADAIHEAWETLRAGLTETPFLTLTGYGRQLVDFADKQVTEISCHGLGARLLAPDTRTVIDIGGQRRTTGRHYRRRGTARHYQYVHGVCRIGGH